MFNVSFLSILSVLIGSLLASGYANAQNAIKVTPAAGSIHMLAGKGGNIGLFIGDDGTFLIDDQYAPMTEKILEAVKATGGDTPRFLINTHYHGDHSGGNENMGNAGALIVSHHNVRKRLAEGTTIAAFNSTTPPKTGAALPVVTYSSDMSFHLNGETVKVIHIPGAHTDGDSIVHFTGSNVIHTGDLFFNGFFPFIDVQHGGSLRGMLSAADKMLSMANDDTVIIPGHGPLSNKAELNEYRDMLATAHQHLSKLKAEGKTVFEIIAAKPLADLDERWGKVIFNADRWIQVIYDGID